MISVRFVFLCFLINFIKLNCNFQIPNSAHRSHGCRPAIHPTGYYRITTTSIIGSIYTVDSARFNTFYLVNSCFFVHFSDKREEKTINPTMRLSSSGLSRPLAQVILICAITQCWFIYVFSYLRANIYVTSHTTPLPNYPSSPPTCSGLQLPILVCIRKKKFYLLKSE